MRLNVKRTAVMYKIDWVWDLGVSHIFACFNYIGGSVIIICMQIIIKHL